jgi:hypothetical protein
MSIHGVEMNATKRDHYGARMRLWLSSMRVAMKQYSVSRYIQAQKVHHIRIRSRK